MLATLWFDSPGSPGIALHAEEKLMYESLHIQKAVLWEKLKRRSLPWSFSLEITARCNNNCRHCYINLPAGDATARAEELTLEDILYIADQAVEMGAMWCLITGGEPLLRPDFPDIYLGLKRRGLLVGVFTNATLIRKHHVELFKHYPPRDLEVTVYGVTRTTYETVTRCPGSFDAFSRGLHLLLDQGLKVRLKAMALKSNLHEMSQIADFCRNRGRGLYRFDPVIHLRYDRSACRNAEIASERLTPTEIVALERSDPERFQILQQSCEPLIDSSVHNTCCDHLFRCGAGIGEFAISYQGLYRLCSSLTASGACYDLRKGTLREALRDHVPRVRRLRSRNATFLQTCQTCQIANLCLSCPAHAYLETGEMDGQTPYFCEVARARASMLAQSGKRT